MFQPLNPEIDPFRVHGLESSWMGAQNQTFVGVSSNRCEGPYGIGSFLSCKLLDHLFYYQYLVVYAFERMYNPSVQLEYGFDVDSVGR